MPKRQSIEDQINSFLEIWDCEQLTAFLSDVIPLLELYNVDRDDDWVADVVGKENATNIRLIRTVYLVSRLADYHTGKLAKVKIDFKDLWRKMEKECALEFIDDSR